MWKSKKFETERDARQWMKDNAHKYQTELVFGNNCMYVEYRPLRRF